MRAASTILKRLKPDIENKITYAILLAILAAVLNGISTPISKILLVEIPPTLMAALLYLGAGFGMLTINVVNKYQKKAQKEAKITKKELPYIIAMIFLDIMAPIFLMLGLSLTTASSTSLLTNFEVVATSLIALIFFKEKIGRRMWAAIAFITLATIILFSEDITSFKFSLGSIFVVLACLSWGVENNCTRKLSIKDPLQIVVINGFGSGIGALIISITLHELSGAIVYIAFTLLLGFVSYGLSIYFYIKAQRWLGAARTSTYYAATPFIGVIFSWLILHEAITSNFIIALFIMMIGVYLAATEKYQHFNVHEGQPIVKKAK